MNSADLRYLFIVNFLWNTRDIPFNLMLGTAMLTEIYHKLSCICKMQVRMID
jgi:hypothetical protein